MKLLIILAVLVTTTVFSAELTVIWTNDPTNPPGTQTVVSYGGQAGTYTNSIIVPSGVSSVVISNLPPGKTIFVAARAYDGVDFSIYSNEDSRKTKLNRPSNLSVTP